MPPDTLVIRVDGGTHIGMGHVMRCLSLVAELVRRSPMEVRFLMRQFQAGVRRVEAQGYVVETIPAEADAPEEVACLRTLLDVRQVEGLITDLRTLTPGLVEEAQAHGVVCATIDEWGNRAICSDLLVNGTIVPAWHTYTFDGQVRACIGPRYALVDPQFAEWHRRPRVPHDGPPRLLIALGGDDPFCLTTKAMRALEPCPQRLDVTVVIGPAFVNDDEIVRAASASRHRYTVHRNASNMAELMAHTDVAFSGGGLTALELACTGTPGVILCEVPHQLETAAVLEQHGAALNLGFGMAVPDTQLLQTTSELLEDEARRRRMSDAGKRLLDGQGCVWVARVILEAIEARGNRDEPRAVRVPVRR